MESGRVWGSFNIWQWITKNKSIFSSIIVCSQSVFFSWGRIDLILLSKSKNLVWSFGRWYTPLYEKGIKENQNKLIETTLGSGLTGKPGRAWVVHGCVNGFLQWKIIIYLLENDFSPLTLYKLKNIILDCTYEIFFSGGLICDIFINFYLNLI